MISSQYGLIFRTVFFICAFLSVSIFGYAQGPTDFRTEIEGSNVTISWDQLPSRISTSDGLSLPYRHSNVRVTGPNGYSEKFFPVNRSSNTFMLSDLAAGSYTVSGKAAYERGDDEREIRWHDTFEIIVSGFPSLFTIDAQGASANISWLSLPASLIDDNGVQKSYNRSEIVVSGPNYRRVFPTNISTTSLAVTELRSGSYLAEGFAVYGLDTDQIEKSWSTSFDVDSPLFPNGFETVVDENNVQIYWSHLPRNTKTTSGVTVPYRNSGIRITGPNSFSEFISTDRTTGEASVNELRVGRYTILGKAAYERGDDEREISWSGEFEITEAGFPTSFEINPSGASADVSWIPLPNTAIASDGSIVTLSEAEIIVEGPNYLKTFPINATSDSLSLTQLRSGEYSIRAVATYGTGANRLQIDWEGEFQIDSPLFPDGFEALVDGNAVRIYWSELPRNTKTTSGVTVPYRNSGIRIRGPNNFSQYISTNRTTIEASVSELRKGRYTITGAAAYERGDDEREVTWFGEFEITEARFPTTFNVTTSGASANLSWIPLPNTAKTSDGTSVNFSEAEVVVKGPNYLKTFPINVASDNLSLTQLRSGEYSIRAVATYGSGTNRLQIDWESGFDIDSPLFPDGFESTISGNSVTILWARLPNSTISTSGVSVPYRHSRVTVVGPNDYFHRITHSHISSTARRTNLNLDELPAGVYSITGYAAYGDADGDHEREVSWTGEFEVVGNFFPTRFTIDSETTVTRLSWIPLPHTAISDSGKVLSYTSSKISVTGPNCNLLFPTRSNTTSINVSTKYLLAGSYTANATVLYGSGADEILVEWSGNFEVQDSLVLPDGFGIDVDSNSVDIVWGQLPSVTTADDGLDSIVPYRRASIVVTGPNNYSHRFDIPDRTTNSLSLSNLAEGEYSILGEALYEDADGDAEKIVNWIGDFAIDLDVTGESPRDPTEFYPKKIPALYDSKNPIDVELGGEDYFGTLAGEHSVGPDGSFSYSIPIEIAPGINGAQPSLSLEYNSNASNAYLGYGWTLAGAGGSIKRCPRNFVRDGKVSTILFGDDYAFCLNNQRLVETSAGEYRTESESFSRITPHGGTNQAPEYWVVEYNDGRTEYYGVHGSLPFRLDGQNQRYAWYLARVEDIHGNYYEYNYESPRVGVHRLKNIAYSFNPSAQSSNHKIHFFYESRQDEVLFYEAGVPMSMDERLERIASSTGNQYYLNYAPVGEELDPTSVSRLEKVEYCSSSSKTKCHDPIVFKWNDNSRDKMQADTSRLKYHPTTGNSYEDQFRFVDKLGSSFPFSTTANEDIPSRFYAGWVIFGMHSQSEIDQYFYQIPRNPAPAGHKMTSENAVRGDFDGDNKNEVVWYWESNADPSRRGDDPVTCDFYVSMNGQTPGTRFAQDIVCDPRGGSRHATDPYLKGVAGLAAHDRLSAHVIDINGDGLDDVYLTSPFETAGMRFYISNGTTLIENDEYFIRADELGIEAQHPLDSPQRTTRFTYHYEFSDLNGDGLLDIVRAAPAIENRETLFTLTGVGRNDISVALNTGNGFEDFREWGKADDYLTVVNAILHSAPPSIIVSDTRDTTARFGDVNGDGLADIIGFMPGEGIEVGINTGNSFEYRNDWASWIPENPSNLSFNSIEHAYRCNNNSAPTLYNYSQQLSQFGDVNGDGLTDIVFAGESGLYVSLSTGQSFLEPELWTTETNAELIICGKEADSTSGVRHFGKNVWKLADFNQDGKADIGIQKLRDDDSPNSSPWEQFDRYEILFSFGAKQSSGKGFSELVRVYENNYFSRPVLNGGPTVHMLDFQVSESGEPYIVDAFKRAPDLTPWQVLTDDIVIGQNKTKLGKTNSIIYNWASYKSGIKYNHITEIDDGRGVNTQVTIESINRNPSLYIQDATTESGRVNFSRRGTSTQQSSNPSKSLPTTKYDGTQTAFNAAARVVKNVVVRSGPDTVEENSHYRYRNHMAHRSGYGGLGFESIEKTQIRVLFHERLRSVTHYLQEFDESGTDRYVLNRPYQIDTCTVRQTLGAYGCDINNAILLEQNKKNWMVRKLGTADYVHYFPFIFEEETKTYDLESTQLISTQYMRLGDLSESQSCPDFEFKTPFNRDISFDAYHDEYGTPKIVSDIYCDQYGQTGSKTENTNIENNLDTWVLGLVEDPKVTTWNYDSDTSENRSITRHTRYQFDSFGRIDTKTREPDAGNEIWLEEDFDYDAYGFVDQYKERVRSFANDGITFTERNTRTQNTYSSNGELTQILTNAANHSVTTLFHPIWGTPTQVTDANELVTSNSYNEFGQLVSSRIEGGPETQYRYLRVPEGVFDYNNTAEYYTHRKADGEPPSFVFYDGLDREVGASTINFNGERVNTGRRYTHFGWLSEETLPFVSENGAGVETNPTSYTYDILGRVTETRFPNGAVQTLQHQAFGGFFVVTATDSNENPTYRYYDAIGREKEVKDALGTSVKYRHDALGNVDQVTVQGENEDQDSESITHAIEFDILGRRTLLMDPDLGYIDYEYNAFGHLISQTNAESEKICYEFDQLDRQIRRRDGGISQCGSIVQTWQYDQEGSLGLLSQVSGTDTNGRVHRETYEYTSHYLLRSTDAVINGETLNLTNHYDKYDRLSGMSYPGGYTIQNTYNDNGYLEVVTDAHNYELLYWANDVDKWGNVTDLSFGNGMDVFSQFNADTGLLNSRRAVLGLGDVQNQTFIFDNEGNLRQRFDDRVGIRQDFCYDPLYRLTDQVINGSCVDDNGFYIDTAYAYDIHGNILRKDEITDYRYGQSESNAGPHAVSFAKGARYHYDSAGRMISGKGRTVEYSSFGKPTRMAFADYSTDIIYGAMQQRVERLDTEGSKTTRTLYLGKYYERIDSSESGREHRFYLGDWGIHVINEPENKEYNVYLTRDHIGSIVSKTDDYNTDTPVIKHLANEPWGRRQNEHWGGEVYDRITGDQLTETSFATTRGFTDHEHLDGVGLIHMNGRVYDPVIGRFVSPDPWIQDPENAQSFNRYSYVWNNPLKYTDPTGETACYTDGLTTTCGSLDAVAEAAGIDVGSLGISDSTHEFYKISNPSTDQSVIVAVPLGDGNGESRSDKAIKEIAAMWALNRIYNSDTSVSALNLGAKSYEIAPGLIIDGGELATFNDLLEQHNSDIPCLGCPFIPRPPDSVLKQFGDFIAEAWRLSQGALPAGGQVIRGVNYVSSVLWVLRNGTKAVGSGPAKGFLEVSSNFKSSKAVQNLTNSIPIDFIFDPKSQRFIMGKNSLGHDGIRMAGGIGHKDIVGGSIWRQNGKLMTDQSSGHYGTNWTASIREQFTTFMKQNGVDISHSATYRK